MHTTAKALSDIRALAGAGSIVSTGNRISSVRMRIGSEGWSMKFKWRSAVICLSAAVMSVSMVGIICFSMSGRIDAVVLSVIALLVSAFVIGGLLDA